MSDNPDEHKADLTHRSDSQGIFNANLSTL